MTTKPNTWYACSIRGRMTIGQNRKILTTLQCWSLFIVVMGWKSDSRKWYSFDHNSLLAGGHITFGIYGFPLSDDGSVFVRVTIGLNNFTSIIQCHIAAGIPSRDDIAVTHWWNNSSACRYGKTYALRCDWFCTRYCVICANEQRRKIILHPKLSPANIWSTLMSQLVCDFFVYVLSWECIVGYDLSGSIIQRHYVMTQRWCRIGLKHRCIDYLNTVFIEWNIDITRTKQWRCCLKSDSDSVVFCRWSTRIWN